MILKTIMIERAVTNQERNKTQKGQVVHNTIAHCLLKDAQPSPKE